MLLSKPIRAATPLLRQSMSVARLSSKPSPAASGAGGSGLNFALTEEQQSYQDMARKFAREEVAPRAAQYDRDGKYPRELINKAHELGIMTMHLPESVGGQGLGLLDSCKLDCLYVARSCI